MLYSHTVWYAGSMLASYDTHTSLTPLRRDMLRILEAGYKAITIETLMPTRFRVSGDMLIIRDVASVTRMSLKGVRHIYIAGFGKGSATACVYIATQLKNRLTEGVVIDALQEKKYHVRSDSRMRVFWGTHPLPSRQNVMATKHMVRMVRSATKDDMVIYFVGGGGSSLLCGSMEEMKRGRFSFDALTKHGAAIEELNVVRKHMSSVKGGWLAAYAAPARQVSLVVSDVCGNDMATIASGPTMYDMTTVTDASTLLKKYGVPACPLAETPKDKELFVRSSYHMLACNEDAVLAMIKKARALGYAASVGSLALSGEAYKALWPLAQKVHNREAIICAGETTVTIHGTGRGGRNQEAVLGVVAAMQKDTQQYKGVCAASVASDGYDNTNVAGAIADSDMAHAALSAGLDAEVFLKNNNSYSFFKKTGGHVIAQKKCFNVSDVMVVIRK